MTKRLFIIDDDVDILTTLKMWFKSKGFEVEVFSFPDPLLDALQHSTPHVILMDVNLEGKDGRVICKELKQNHLAKCPILLFSANPFVLKDWKAYLADGAIEKPFSLKEITNVITSYIEI